MDITQELLDLLSHLPENEIAKELDRFMLVLSHLRGNTNDKALKNYCDMLGELGNAQNTPIGKSFANKKPLQSVK